MTTDEVAEYLRTPAATVRYWVHRGEGPRSFKIGRRRMFRRQDVDAWLMGQINAERGPGDKLASL